MEKMFYCPKCKEINEIETYYEEVYCMKYKGKKTIDLENEDIDDDETVGEYNCSAGSLIADELDEVPNMIKSIIRCKKCGRKIIELNNDITIDDVIIKIDDENKRIIIPKLLVIQICGIVEYFIKGYNGYETINGYGIIIK